MSISKYSLNVLSLLPNTCNGMRQWDSIMKSNADKDCKILFMVLRHFRMS